MTAPQKTRTGRREKDAAIKAHVASFTPMRDDNNHQNTDTANEKYAHQYFNGGSSGYIWPSRRTRLERSQYTPAMNGSKSSDEDREDQQDDDNETIVPEVEYKNGKENTDWAPDLYEVLSQSQFRPLEDEEREALTLQTLETHTRKFAPIPRRADISDSVITVLRVSERGVAWDLEEDGTVRWLQDDDDTATIRGIEENDAATRTQEVMHDGYNTNDACRSSGLPIKKLRIKLRKKSDPVHNGKSLERNDDATTPATRPRFKLHMKQPEQHGNESVPRKSNGLTVGDAAAEDNRNMRSPEYLDPYETTCGARYAHGTNSTSPITPVLCRECRRKLYS